MKKIKAVFSVFALVFVMLSLFGCAPKITVEELKAALPALVDASKPLNEIYLGEGFSRDESIVDENETYGYFYCDTMEYGLHSISDIKDATEKVFTPEYAAVLYQAAFEGLSVDTLVEGARYAEGEMGLMQKEDAEKFNVSDRAFDYDSIKIVKGGRKNVKISIITEADGKKEEIEMMVVRYGDEGNFTYRLDSPTY